VKCNYFYSASSKDLWCDKYIWSIFRKKSMS